MNETYIKTYSDAENHSHPTNSDNLRINNINVKVQKKNQTFSNLNTNMSLNMKSINPRLNFDILLKKAKKLEKRKIKKFFIMNKDFLTKIDFVTIKKIKVIRFDKNNENCSSLSKQISKKAIENNFNFKRKRVAIFDKRKNSLIICLYKNQNDINILDN
ncbi:hypothetical protein GVAV_001051 [Gurleya vavrai]